MKQIIKYTREEVRTVSRSPPRMKRTLAILRLFAIVFVAIKFLTILKLFKL